MPAVTPAIKNFLEKLGFGQIRCAHCMTPFFPGSVARSDTFAPERLCANCQKLFNPYKGGRCRLCGNPTSAGQTAGNHPALCLHCHRRPPPWKSVAFYGLYLGPLRDALLRLKFDGELQLAPFLGGLLLQACVCLPAPDLLTVIPQYPTHLRRRGFNQAYEIGRAFARFSGMKMKTGLIKRIRPALPQEGLTALERRANLRGAFWAHKQVKNKKVWLIDDVLTTGATCVAASLALLNAGAREVRILCVARTPLARAIA